MSLAPSREKATVDPANEGVSILKRCLPVLVSHRWTVPSAPIVARAVLSGETLATLRAKVFRSILNSCLPLDTCQRCTCAPSRPTVRSVPPSGENRADEPAKDGAFSAYRRTPLRASQT
jgi:hypothetical protein